MEAETTTAEKTKAFDKFASHFSADECETKIDEILATLKGQCGLKPSLREELLDDLSGWIRHYRIKTYTFRQGE